MIYYFTHWEENSIEYFCYTTGCEQEMVEEILVSAWKDFINTFF